MYMNLHKRKVSLKLLVNSMLQKIRINSVAVIYKIVWIVFPLSLADLKAKTFVLLLNNIKDGMLFNTDLCLVLTE